MSLHALIHDGVILDLGTLQELRIELIRISPKPIEYALKFGGYRIEPLKAAVDRGISKK